MDTYQTVVVIIGGINVIGALIIIPLFNRISKIEDKLEKAVLKEDLDRHLSRIEKSLEQVNNNILRLMEIKT